MPLAASFEAMTISQGVRSSPRSVYGHLRERRRELPGAPSTPMMMFMPSCAAGRRFGIDNEALIHYRKKTIQTERLKWSYCMKAHVIAVPIAAAMLAVSGHLAQAGDLPYHGDGHIMMTPDDLEWGEVASMEDPAKIAVIEGNLGEPEPFTLRVKMPDGYELRPHVHPAYERVTVLQGTLHFAHGEEFDRDATTALPEGSVAIMSPGDPMFGYTEGEVIIQLHGTGPWGIEYIDEADDPRS